MPSTETSSLAIYSRHHDKLLADCSFNRRTIPALNVLEIHVNVYNGISLKNLEFASIFTFSLDEFIHRNFPHSFEKIHFLFMTMFGIESNCMETASTNIQFRIKGHTILRFSKETRKPKIRNIISGCGCENLLEIVEHH